MRRTALLPAAGSAAAMALAVVSAGGCASETTTSPDGSLAVSVNVSKPLTCQIKVDEKTVLATSRIGLEFDNGLRLSTP